MRRGLKGQVGGAPSLRKILLVIAVLVLGLELVYVQLPTQDGPSVSSVEADLMRLGASSLQRKRQLAIQQQNVENESEDDNDEDDHELAPHVDKRTASYDEDASWPLYDVNVNERSGKPMDWPGVGWNKGKETGSESLLKKFKFYLYEDGPFDMRKAEKCMRAHKNLPSTGFGELDEHLRLEEREHLPELFLLPALRAHPMRTDNKDHADLFIIGFSHSLAGMAMPCENHQSLQEWEHKVANALTNSDNFNRRGGRDFLFLHSTDKWEVSEILTGVLDSGPMIATSDRYSLQLQTGLPTAWHRGSVLVMPYVSSAALDMYHVPPRPKLTARTYYFRGDMHRLNGDRSLLEKLANQLSNSDFEHVDSDERPPPAQFARILNTTADEMRSAAVCLCPEGDMPTSVRFFESLVAGCVPVVAAAQALADTLQSMSMPSVGIINAESMREEGTHVYDRFFSYFRNPEGVASGMLIEASLMMEKHGVLHLR